MNAASYCREDDRDEQEQEFTFRTLIHLIISMLVVIKIKIEPFFR